MDPNAAFPPADCVVILRDFVVEGKFTIGTATSELVAVALETGVSANIVCNEMAPIAVTSDDGKLPKMPDTPSSAPPVHQKSPASGHKAASTASGNSGASGGGMKKPEQRIEDQGTDESQGTLGDDDEDLSDLEDIE